MRTVMHFVYVGGIMEAFSDSIANVLSGEDVELVGLSEHEALFQRDSHEDNGTHETCLLYTSPSPRDKRQSRMPSSA